MAATGKYYISGTNVGWWFVRFTVQGVGTVTKIPSQG